MPKKTMVIGADVNHMAGQKSIIGFTASMDRRLSKYFSVVDVCNK